MELPDEIIDLIRAFSKPLTNPYWKTMHKVTHADLYNDLYTNGHCVTVTKNTSIIEFKHIIMVVENDVFWVFRVQDFVNNPW